MKYLKHAAALLMATAMSAPVLAADLENEVADDYPYLEKLFVDFHEHPELSFRETRTAAKIADELTALGFDVTTGVAETGLVAMMKNGDGPLVMVRADMDGLPVKENTGLAYQSKATQVDMHGIERPVMHACGHDVHITSLIGTARRLVKHKDEWSGTLMLVGQPAEEVISGAKAMIKDDIFKRFGTPDYALALHVASGVPAGKVVYKSGIMFSSSDSVHITVHGVGTHGASPHMGKDPIVIGAQIVNALQTLVSREISPLDPGVVTVGTFHAGTKNNIISDEAKLTLTVRSNDEAVREKLLQGIKRIAENTGRVAGLPEDMLPTVELSLTSAPTTVNDDELTVRLDKALKEKMGEDQLLPYVQRGMGAEDFSEFTMTDEDVPGFYFYVGGTPQEWIDAAKEGGPAISGHHSPLFKIAPEPSIKAGVEAMTIAVMDLMKK
ncbi:amidohydrolase [Kordiimonas aestuarii]|uniref:amidohydrolase n=1 Tax=Kordiimonas aestuarii TaxID=1005925 RepID=UPI0021CFA3B0|nr:amidohydrolase [Kordiimonas aestuarii]